MLVTYRPDGDEAQAVRWSFDARRGVRALEREAIERAAGMTYAAWVDAVTEGSSLARRVLLWHLLRREHRATRLDDVDFAWDDLTVEWTKGELRRSLDDLSKLETAEAQRQRALILALMDDAPEDPEPGEARRPSAA